VVDDKSSVYGEELAELTHSIIGLVSGDQLVVNLTKDEGLNAGEYAIIVTYEPNPNYEIEVVEGTYTIKKAASVISAEDMTVTYDGTAHSIEATLNHGESELVYENNGQVNAGVYTVVIRVAESTNYLTAEIERTLTINPRPVQIVVDDKSSVFGEPLLSLTYSVVGLVGDDTLIVVLSKEEGISVGEYAITAIFEQNPNYSVTVVEGVYRIVVDEQKLAQLIQLLGNLNFDDIFGEYDNLVSIGDLIDEIGEENISENYLEAYHEAIEVFNNYVETANQELEEAIAVGSIITRRFDIVTAVRALFALTSTIVIGAFFFARRKFFRG
jgi:DNA-directed RNA polymerase subunit L